MFGLLIFSAIIPPLRQLHAWLAILVVALIIILVVGSVCRLLYRTPGSKPRYRTYDLETLQTADSPGMDFERDLPILNTAPCVPLIQRLRSIDWFQFEKALEIIYARLGYNVRRRGGANPDGGIDLVLEKDGVKTAVQCKHWKARDVGVKPIREFLGALADSGIKNGIFVTLSGYTDDARRLADLHGIEMLNEAGLAALLETANPDLDAKLLAFLDDTTKYCPRCERVMVLRTALRGSNAGSKFWGCSGYPLCDGTMPVR